MTDDRDVGHSLERGRVLGGEYLSDVVVVGNPRCRERNPRLPWRLVSERADPQALQIPVSMPDFDQAVPGRWCREQAMDRDKRRVDHPYTFPCTHGFAGTIHSILMDTGGKQGITAGLRGRRNPAFLNGDGHRSRFVAKL